MELDKKKQNKQVVSGEEIIKELIKELKKYRDSLDQYNEALENVKEEISKLTAKYDYLALVLDSLVKSIYSRFIWEELRLEVLSESGRVVRKERNARIEDTEVDFLIETLRKVYVVDIRVKPKIDDISKLLVKADILSNKYIGKLIIPVLAGTVIEDNVKDYAKSRGVRVYKL